MYAAGDVIGCGLDRVTCRCFFTINGVSEGLCSSVKRIDSLATNVRSTLQVLHHSTLASRAKYLMEYTPLRGSVPQVVLFA